MAETKAVELAERRDSLAEALNDVKERGGRIEYQGEFQANVVWGKPVNHALHLVMTLITGSLWLIVWFYFLMTGGERQEVLEAKENGTVERTEMSYQDQGLTMIIGVMVVFVIITTTVMLARWLYGLLF
ncbi:MAG: hypothetical protein OXN19_16030 [Caldilineaceae bacterium]|nr:hypothetical protein [Caldilineaceae bacterium]